MQPDPNLVPSSTLAVERALIGGCLLDSRGSRAWPTLVPEQFFLDRHQQIWSAMLDLTEKTERPDLVLLAAELERRGALEAIGGAAYLALCAEDGMLAADLQRHGAEIRRAYTAQLRAALGREVALHPEASDRVAALLAALERDPSTDEIAAPQLLATLAGRPTEPTYRTGFPALDAKTGGIARGQLVVLGGRTSHGKTAFALELSARFARDGYAVAYLTLEDPPAALGRRLAAAILGRPIWSIRAHGAEIAQGSVDDLASLGIFSPAATEDAVLGTVAATPAAIVVVDHLQQITTHDESRNAALERVMARLASLARRQEKAIIVTAQLNRQMETRRGEPTLGDLRDSGAIEQAARQAWLLYWPLKHDADVDPQEYRVIVAKNAEGATGVIRLAWDAPTGRFWNWDAETA